jgi:hypothetical protein
LNTYVARRLTEKRRRGRPKRTEWQELLSVLYAYALACQVALNHARFKRDKKRSPKQLALEAVAKDANLAPSTLRAMLKRGHRNWVPPLTWDFDWPTLKLAQRVLEGEDVPGWWGRRDGGEKIPD